MKRKVLLPGHGTFWFLESDGCGPLAPLDQCDESGELHLIDALISDSYAHVYADGTIKRYRQVIGRIENLEDVE